MGSGNRTIRNELNRPISPARIGISYATCNARCRASVLMLRISSWTRLARGELLLELGVARHLGVVLERVGDPLLIARREHARPRAICWSNCCETTYRYPGALNRSGSSSVGFCSRLRRTSHQASAPTAIVPARIGAATDSPPSCHAKDAEHDAADPEHRQNRADHVDAPGTRVGHVAHEPGPERHDHDHHVLEHEPDPP